MEKQYLVWFGRSNSYFNLRFLELESLARMYGCSDPGAIYVGDRPTPKDTEPFAIVRFPNEEIAHRICERSVLTKFIVEVWGSGASDEEVMDRVRSCLPDNDWVNQFADRTFSYKVVPYGTNISDTERRQRMSAFSNLFRGTEKVDVKNPGITLYIVDEHEGMFGQTGTRNELIAAPRKRTFYGRLVAESTNEFRRRYALPDRPILGPTSLDNDLAFLMANVAEIKNGTLVLDPFCGTGGLLIAASACSQTPPIGSDIDMRVLKGECVAYVKNHIPNVSETRKDIYQNFDYYEMSRPEIIANDNSNLSWRTNRQFVDVILTDPPYGVRAGAKKIGMKYDHEVGERGTYHPQMLGYNPSEVNDDLVSLSIKLLVDDGVVVFLQHVELMDLFTQEELDCLPRDLENSGGCTKILEQRGSKRIYVYANECARDPQFLDEKTIIERVVPQHPHMRIEGAALQILAAGTGRLLVKMRRERRSEI